MVLYDESKRQIWSTDTGYYSHKKVELVVEDDNNVVLYHSYDVKRPYIWSTETKDRYCPDVELGKSV